MATYYPLIGNNIIASFVDAGAGAVTRTAGATLAAAGQTGKRRCSVVITATPASVANDRTLTLTLVLPDGLKEISAGVSNLNLMRPSVTLTSGDQQVDANTAANTAVTYGAVTTASVGGVTKYVIPLTITTGAATSTAGAKTLNLVVDWGASATN